jgi:signal transduction histidine kinase/CheY-like chemotaxis protein
MLQQNISILVPQEFRKHHHEHIKSFQASAIPRDMGSGDVFPALHKLGHVVHVCIALRPLSLDGKDYTVATITQSELFNDMSNSLRNSEQKLKDRTVQNHQLMTVATNANESVLLLNEVADITWLNQTAEHFFQDQFGLQLGQSFLTFSQHANDVEQWEQVSSALHSGLMNSAELQCTTVDNQEYWLQIIVHPMFEQEHLQGFVIYAKDTTAQRELETRLQENNEILEATARIANLGFYSLDIKTNQVIWSDHVYHIHDLPLGTHVTVEEAFEFYAPSAKPLIIKAVEDCITSGEPFDLELPFITAKKREIWVKAVGYAEYVDEQPVKIKGAFQDISHMRLAALKANQAMRAKSAFLANMSHELRTPINGIMGLSDLLQQTSLSQTQIEFTQMIQRSAEELLYLVNQVLDFSKLEANKQSLKNTTFDLLLLMKESLYIHKVAAKKKGLTFTVNIDSDVPDLMVSDKERLKQILNNLCSNAIKFTEKGSIKVDVSRPDEESLSISITDTGVGIADSDISKLFNEFEQLDSSFSREYGGTGLGLSITKQLVTLLGGKIHVVSQLGQGSEFAFSLPIEQAISREQSALNSLQLPAMLVLIADVAQRKMWEALAENYRLDIKLVDSGRALISVLKSEQKWRIVTIFGDSAKWTMDTLIPSVKRVMREHQSLYWLLAEPNTYVDQKWRMTSLKHTFEDSSKSVEQAIVNVANHYQKNSKVNINSLEGKRILIAEDNEINQVVCHEMLQSFGIKTKVANDGLEALALLNTGECFDMIIMDCQMPRLDGYQATSKIKHHKNEKVRQHTIIAATAHALQEDIQRCYDVGMVDVLIKPFTHKQLMDILLRNL